MEAPGPSRWTYAAAGLAAGTAIAGGALAIAAGAIDPGADAKTGPDVTVDELASDAETAHGLAVAADVFFGLAVASGVASVVLAATTRAPSPGAPTTGRIELLWRGTAVGARWRF